MKKIADFLTNRRFILLSVTLVLTVVCGILATMVPVNRDRTNYLADDSSMKRGLSLLETAFPKAEEASSIRVVFDDLSAAQIAEIKARLEAIPDVSRVDHDAESPEYHRDNHTLFVVNSRFDYHTAEEKAIEDAIENGFPGFTMTYQNNAIPSTVVPLWLLLTALGLAVLILLILSPSWLDPLLFLVTIGIAIVLNAGTNTVLPYIDEMTAAVGPILQLTLSMDYSIILMTRYRQERANCRHKCEAMKNALAGSLSSIASSAFTTSVGLLALLCLSFKLGPELGIVLAKGVLISMLCVFTVLPALILAFDRWLERTRKKVPHIPIGRVAAVSHKARRLAPAVLAVLLIGSFFLQRLTTVTFTEKSEDRLADIFPKDNTVVVVYRNDDEEQIGGLVDALEDDAHITSVLGYPHTLGKALTADEMCDAIAGLSGEINIGADVMRILYDVAAGEEPPVLTVGEFLPFIATAVLPNDSFGQYVSTDVSDNVRNWVKFADSKTLTTPMTVDETAAFFEMDQDSVAALYLYYALQNGVEDTGTMTLPVFIDFVRYTVASDPAYSALVDTAMLASLNQMAVYTDIPAVQAKRTPAELASLLGMDQSVIDAVLPLYSAEGGGDTLSLQTFVDFMLSNPHVSSMMDPPSLERLRLVQAIIRASVQKTAFTAAALADFLGMDAAETEQLYILYRSQNGAFWQLSPRELVRFAVNDAPENAEVADLKRGHILIEAVAAEKALTTKEMSALFSSLTDTVSEEVIEVMYLYYGAVNRTGAARTMTLPQFFDFLCDTWMNDERFAGWLDSETRADLQNRRADLADAVAQMKGATYSRLILTADYADESPETAAYLDRLDDLCQNHLGEYYLVGNSVMVREMDKAFDREYRIISLITAIAIFLVVLMAFRQPTLPLLLTLIVQCGVFLTVTVIGAYSGSIYYLALLIVQSILMGSTIDYGIVFCHFYRESRKTANVPGALKAAYEGSIHTILTSGSILILVLAILGSFVSSPLIAEVAITLSIGVLIAVLLILLVLPGMVAVCDKWTGNRSPDP